MNITSFKRLSRSFYTSPDVVKIARDLVGKYLISKFDGEIAIGKIVETEAYNGRNDKACHAFLKRTKRTEVMYEQGGKTYIYLCYGIHHLFNIVTNEAGLADAVLVRAIEPVTGLDTMQERRGISGKHLTSGPGKLSQAFGLHTRYSGEDLVESERIWIGTNSESDESIVIETDVRIGVDYAEEDALLPWRFYEKGNRFVSKKKSPKSG